MAKNTAIQVIAVHTIQYNNTQYGCHFFDNVIFKFNFHLSANSKYLSVLALNIREVHSNDMLYILAGSIASEPQLKIKSLHKFIKYRHPSAKAISHSAVSLIAQIFEPANYY